MQADASTGVWIRSLVPLGFVTSLVGLTGAFVVPFLPLFLSQTLHAGPGQISLLLFLSPLSTVIVATVVGRISDRPGVRRRVLVLAAVAGLVGFGAYAVLRHYWVVLAVSVTLVAISGSLMPQIFAYGREMLDRRFPTRAAMGVNSLRMMLSLAWAAGAPLGAVVIGLIDFDGLFLATAVAHVAILGVIILLKSPSSAPVPATPPVPVVPVAPPVPVVPAAPATPPVPEAGGSGAVAREPGLAAGRPSAVTLVGTTIAFVILQCVTSLTVMTMPLFVSVTLRGDVTRAGAVLGLCAALEIPLMLIFGALASRWPLHQLLLLGGGFGMAYCFAVSVSTSVWQVAAAQVLHACFVCAIGGLGISYFQELLPSALGQATTMFTNTGRISGMFSGLVFGLATVHGYRLSYVVSLGLCLVGTATLAVIGRPRPTRVDKLISPTDEAGRELVGAECAIRAGECGPVTRAG